MQYNINCFLPVSLFVSLLTVSNHFFCFVFVFCLTKLKPSLKTLFLFSSQGFISLLPYTENPGLSWPLVFCSLVCLFNYLFYGGICCYLYTYIYTCIYTCIFIFPTNENLLNLICVFGYGCVYWHEFKEFQALWFPFWIPLPKCQF